MLPTVYINPVDPDWSFKLSNLGGPFMFRVAGLPANWTLGAVRLNEKDITDAPWDVPTGAKELVGLKVVVTQKIGALVRAGRRRERQALNLRHDHRIFGRRRSLDPWITLHQDDASGRPVTSRGSDTDGEDRPWGGARSGRSRVHPAQKRNVQARSNVGRGFVMHGKR